ncbi:hypothetical protein KAU11_10860, partial [Candidatus Babeliales bacterium]|nr:hypothetical protein [Candidatus Babeliales bacterium]
VMNEPHKSKINWTAAVISVIGLVAAYDVIPPKAEEHLVEIAMIGVGPIIIVFRTYFTGRK